MNYSNHISQISTNPGAFPRSIDNQYPLIVDKTRTLTVSKCNIWRACLRESFFQALQSKRPMSFIDPLTGFQVAYTPFGANDLGTFNHA